jgi:hypothetical protein
MEPTILKSLGSGKMVIEGSVSFKGNDFENMISIKTNHVPSVPVNGKSAQLCDDQSPNPDAPADGIRKLAVQGPSSPKHEAAVKLQKVYKSFRTRRKLADCAVLVEQSWWKLLDFAELKRSSISFFNIEKHETAISRWSRARTRAAKVGKGLSKNAKAQKLALQHWLEAIDPRHRYGHNLQFYYIKWLQCQSREPFFYWLDIGEGKEVNLVEKCPRTKLQQQCIKYLGPMERKSHEVVINDGKFYKQTQELLHTSGEYDNVKWIFVLSTSKNLYVGKKKKGKFQHSSFLAGGATVAAGRLVVENGILKALWPHSGHYRPTEENFRDFISFLKENNVDLNDVKISPMAEDDHHSLNNQQSSNHMRNNSSEDDSIENLINLVTGEINPEDLTEVKSNSTEQEQEINVTLQGGSHNFRKKLTGLEIPATGKLFEGPESVVLVESRADGYKSIEEEEEISVTDVPKESILQRINSHKGTRSYQLGKQLSFKWTTGAGPRIGCVRDYPSELQVRALEQVNLSPRSAGQSRSFLTPRASSGGLSSTPTYFGAKLETAISLTGAPDMKLVAGKL